MKESTYKRVVRLYGAENANDTRAVEMLESEVESYRRKIFDLEKALVVRELKDSDEYKAFADLCEQNGVILQCGFKCNYREVEPAE